MSSPPNAISRDAPESQSTPYGSRTAASAANYNPPRQLSASAQSAPCQAYQSNPPYRGYQKTDEKRVYQLDEDPVENQLEGFYTTFDENDKEFTYADEGFEKVAVNFVGIEASYSKYRATFPSKSKLHHHLKSGCQEVTSLSFPARLASAIPIIASKAVHQSFGSGLAFRGWTYATATVTLAPDHLPPDSNLESTAYLDTGCGVTLVDKGWLAKYLPAQKISTMSTPLKVRGIGASKHESGEFAVLSLYFPGKDNAGQLVYASLTCKIHLVEDLRANLLIGNDIMSPEGFVIDVKGKKALISSCEVTVPIDARQRGQFLARKLLTNQETIIPPNSEAMISLLPLPLPDDRDFLFHPATQPSLTLFTHIVDHRTSKILVRNASNDLLRIPRHHKLGHLIDIAYDNCFLANTQSALDAATSPPSSYQPPNGVNDAPFLATDPSIETVLDNGVKVYGDPAAVKQIADLVAEYPTIWKSKGFVQIPPERWMTVLLKPGWESKVSAIKLRIYPLGNEA